MGVDQSVVRRPAVKLEYEMHHFETVVTEQFVSETESLVQHLSRNRTFEMESHKPTLALPFLDLPQCEPGRGCRDEFAQEASMDGEEGQPCHNPGIFLPAGG